MMNTNRDSVYQSNNRLRQFCHLFSWPRLFEAAKEQNTLSRFASLSEGEMDQIFKEKHSNKTKQMTNWSVSTFKGELKFFLFQIYSCSWK